MTAIFWTLKLHSHLSRRNGSEIARGNEFINCNGLCRIVGFHFIQPNLL